MISLLICSGPDQRPCRSTYTATLPARPLRPPFPFFFLCPPSPVAFHPCRFQPARNFPPPLRSARPPTAPPSPLPITSPPTKPRPPFLFLLSWCFFDRCLFFFSLFFLPLSGRYQSCCRCGVLGGCCETGVPGLLARRVFGIVRPELRGGP